MHLWRLSDGEWKQVPIGSEGLSLRLGEDERLELVDGVAEGALALVLPVEEGGAARASLVTLSRSAAILVNAYRPLGVQILDERDEIILGDELLYFGARSPARVTRFEQTDSGARCARCKRVLHAGDAVTRCPACGAFHHAGSPAGEAEELSCWNHDARCGACARPRDGMLWSPEEEGA